MAVLVPFETLQAAVDDEEYLGFCLACGAQNEEVEPDARRYACADCDALMVFGAEELLLMGAYEGGDYRDGDESA